MGRGDEIGGSRASTVGDQFPQHLHGCKYPNGVESLVNNWFLVSQIAAPCEENEGGFQRVSDVLEDRQIESPVV